MILTETIFGGDLKESPPLISKLIALLKPKH
jgi:hypothetical protein